jgi:hypothetical protein
LSTGHSIELVLDPVDLTWTQPAWPPALAEPELSFVIVVTPASQLDGIDGRLAAQRLGVEVMSQKNSALAKRQSIDAVSDKRLPPRLVVSF